MKPLPLLAALPLFAAAAAEPLRPPSVPLVACDPYFSIWSPHDRLADGPTTHWTGKPHRLECSARIDGAVFRLLGGGEGQALAQTKLELTATRTIATYAGAGVSLRLTFTTPALPDDLDILARPVTYLTFDAVATDGRPHRVEVDFSAGAEIATNTPEQRAEVAAVPGIAGLTVLRAGSLDQQVLAKTGDDIRIDWGYLYLATPAHYIPAHGRAAAATRAGAPAAAPAPAGDLALALSFDLGAVKAPVSRWLILAYDDLYSIQFMRNNLRPFWRRNGWQAADLLAAAAEDYPELTRKCEAFDRELAADLVAAGGQPYADICTLAFRQCFAAGKFVADANGQPLQFSKENHSNGCIATSDIIYPMSPQFLLFGPTLTKSFLVPFMEYASSERWKFPFAPHDLGQYPHANGQRYGGGERSEENQMPVEESGNLLLVFAALAQMEGNADFAGRYWPRLSQWAAYLADKGFDPENQLCTDDFAGHLAHNTNLSIKAICGLGAFAKLAAMRGDQAAADKHAGLAKEFAARWVKEAADDGHYRLAFDRPGSWSQKYNLVWDRILGLGLFPDEVRRTETDHYLRVQNQFGLPLDNRKDYTKLDWILWTATLTRQRADFDALVAPVHRFLQQTTDRAPMSDWYDTKTARKVGFTARPVVGGVFLQMLYDQPLWAKYAGRDQTKAAGWAPMPKPPVVTTIVPTARDKRSDWRFTTTAPGADWFQPGFDDAGWQRAPGGFGTRATPNSEVGTEWNTREIWLRRPFTLPAGDRSRIALRIYHDEDARVWLNGVPAATLTGFSGDYIEAPISDQARAALTTGTNTIAIHCRQSEGGQFIDAGIVEVRPAR